ncbi:unnamed protein product, partial [Polarella glacialis]
GAPSEKAAEGAGCAWKELKVSCKGFRGQTQQHIEKWLGKDVSDVPTQQIFKQRTWGHAFVTVSEDSISKFTQ